MWGSCLLISPILEQGQTELVYYLPKGKWYNYFMFALEESEGVQKKVPVDADSMPLLHLRGGCIIIQQEYANNTHFSRQKPLTILAALDKSNNASGSFFWDDGVGIDTIGSGNYYKADIVLADSSMTLTVNHKPEKETSWTSVDFENLTVLGVDATIQSVKLQEPLKNQAKNLSFKQNGKVLNIELSGIGITQYDSFEVMWSIKAS